MVPLPSLLNSVCGGEINAASTAAITFSGFELLSDDSYTSFVDEVKDGGGEP